LPVGFVENSNNSRPYIALVWIEHALAGDAVCEEDDGDDKDEKPKIAKLNERKRFFVATFLKRALIATSAHR